MNNIIKDLAKKTMTEEKKISYFFTIPFLKTNIKPNTISLISFFPPIIGFLLISFGENLQLKLLGWLMFLLWNILDGVDGNIARYKNQLSKTGSLWDATSGYIAMEILHFWI